MAKDNPCLLCERLYDSMEEAEACAQRHDPLPAFPLPLTLRRGWCAFCDHAPCQCADGRPPEARPLPAAQVLRLGALTLEQEQSVAVERLLEDQRAMYEDCSKGALIEALLDRDRLLAHQGRQIADGRTVGRIAREMIRAALYSAGGRPDAQAVQRAIEAFDPAEREVDARQLKLHGSTLGPLGDPEKAAAALESGALKARPGSATVREGALQKGED